MQKSQSLRGGIIRKTWLVIATFEDERESMVREGSQPLETEIWKDMDPSLELPERTQLC